MALPQMPGHQEVIIASFPPEETLLDLPGAGGGGGTHHSLYSTTQIIGFPAFSDLFVRFAGHLEATVFKRLFLLLGTALISASYL